MPIVLKQVRSRYEEDVHPGNHTSIFGSYYADGKWGYACCHQFVRNSYCTGAAGKEAGESMLTMPPPKQVEAAADEETKVDAVPESSLPVAEKAKEDDADSDSSSGSSDEEARKERERKERKKEEKQKKKREKKKRKKDKGWTHRTVMLLLKEVDLPQIFIHTSDHHVDALSLEHLFPF